MNLKTILINLINLAEFPRLPILNINLISNFELLPLSADAGRRIHRPLVAIELNFNHEDITILHKMCLWYHFCPLILLILVNSFLSLDPEPGVPRRYVVKQLTYFQMHLAQV